MAIEWIINEKRVLKVGRFTALVQVGRVTKNKKYPDGIKAKMVLIDVEQGKPLLLIDNHEPFGYHMHTQLPDNHDHRETLTISGFEEAQQLFFAEVRKITNEEDGNSVSEPG